MSNEIDILKAEILQLRTEINDLREMVGSIYLMLAEEEESEYDTSYPPGRFVT
ncbi:MAG: hypothetical protein ACOX8L_02895 [Candidatus Methanomethylophilaceae archaeon]|jgi:hypothetical protein